MAKLRIGCTRLGKAKSNQIVTLVAQPVYWAGSLGVCHSSSTPRVLSPKLSEAGVSQALIHGILVDNPRRFSGIRTAEKRVGRPVNCESGRCRIVGDAPD